MIETQKHIRKPLYVDAVRVTNDNFDEIATWCQGEVLSDDTPGKGTSKQYIKVRVHNPKNPRQTKAFVGDWLLYTERGYKVYTNKAFHMSFDPAVDNVEDKTPEFPREDGDTVVIGPECFVAKDGSVLSWRGTNYIPQGAELIEETDVAVGPIESVERTHIEEETPEPPVADTRQVISEEDQQAMDPDELRELLKSGEFVLAQDLAA